ncbi:MAG: hypothetical protein FJY10_08600 [Bacteroidetes bacterium]|nr:hypothetical protein [Bacteroidota bacterium]
MSKFDEHIRENRQFFDDLEPPQGHFERFEQRLTQGAEKKSRRNAFFFLKVAASLAVVVTILFFLLKGTVKDVGEMISGELTPADLPQEVQEAMAYYQHKTYHESGMIDSLAISSEEAEGIRSVYLREIKTLDANNLELRKAYNENPNDERILAAIISNEKMKETVLETIIRQMGQPK